MANEQNLKPFKKGVVTNPNGRPKKFVNVVLDELRKEGYKNISKSQVIDIYETLTILPEDKLREMKDDKELPMFYRIIAEEVIGKRKFEALERLLDRAQGRATNSTDVTSGGEKIVIPIYGGLSVGDKDLPNNNSNKKDIQPKEKN